MADSLRDPASTRPLDTSTPRRSRGSHSFHSQASTRSWVQSHQNPPPPQPIHGIPSPVAALRHVEDEDEYMNIQPGDLTQNTLGLHVVNTAPKPKRRFVGGFMTNVKRVFRKRDSQPVWRKAIPEEGSASHAGNAAGQHISTPPSPTRPSMPAAQPFHLSVNEIPEALVAGNMQRKERIQQRPQMVVESFAPSPTEIPVDYTRNSAAPVSRPYSSVPPPPMLSPQPSQRSRQATALLSPNPSHLSQPPPADPHSHPASVQAHPPLADDYRRMSLSKQGGTSSGGDGTEPSFETELNPIHRFFATLYSMPWISSERVTVDYLPGIKRGAWTWKWARREGKDERVLVHVPVRKAMRPWYTGKKQGDIVEHPGRAKVRDSEQRISSWASPPVDPLDLLSSGDSAGSPLSIISMTSSSRHQRRRHRNHRRSYVIFSDLEKPHGTHKTSKHRHKHPQSSSSRRRHPKSPIYPHGYVPAPTPAPSKRTVSPVPTVTPAFYVMQHAPHGAHSPSASPGQGAANHAAPGYLPYLTPVYMQMLPPVALSDVSSSPGMAGRGAGYGYSSMTMPVPLPGQNVPTNNA